MATAVTAAHHFIWRHLYASIQAVQTPASKLRFVTSDKESREIQLIIGKKPKGRSIMISNKESSMSTL